MQNVSKSKKATVIQEEIDEDKPIRKRSLLSETNSGTSDPTPGNNLGGSTNSKVLAKQAIWTDPMEPSDQAAISDAGKDPSGENGDSTASTSKRAPPARNAKGRWARKSRPRKTRAEPGPSKTIKKKGLESELPTQRCSLRIWKKAAQESNLQADIDQKKIIEKDMQDTP